MLEVHAAARPRSRRPLIVIVITVVALIAAGFLVSKGVRRGTGPAESAAGGDVVQTVRAGDMEIVLRAPAGVFRRGSNSFTIDFRSLQSSALVDAGTVRASANMTMPGMAMTSDIQVRPSGTTGRYLGTAEFGMAGSWRFAVEWNGSAGQGSTTFEGKVQ